MDPGGGGSGGGGSPRPGTSTITANLAKWGQPQIRIYRGTLDQPVDPAIIADKGVDNTPAWRGIAYIVIDGLLTQSGAIPNVTIEWDQGTTAVDQIVKDLYALGGVADTNLDVTALSGLTIPGVIRTSQKPIGDTLKDLQTRFQFDMIEFDGLVKAVLRNRTDIDFVIPFAKLRAHLDGSDTPPQDCIITDIDPLLLPFEVDVNYLDPGQDYHNGVQFDRRIDNGFQTDVQSVSLALVDNEHNMKTLASTLLYRPEMEGRSFTFETGPEFFPVVPGAVGHLVLPNATHTVRVGDGKYGLPTGICQFQAVRQAASVYSATGFGAISGAEDPVAGFPSNTKGIILDGPLFRPEDAGDGTDPVLYFGVCGIGGGAWPGEATYQEMPLGSDNYEFIGVANLASGIGRTTGTLASVVDTTVWDTTSTLTVDFYFDPQLATASTGDVEANPNLNLLAIKNPSTGLVECVQFKNATPGTPSSPFVARYTVDHFLRGRFETQNNVGSHTSADEVVFIDSTLKPRRQRKEDIGQILRFKFETSGQMLDSAQVVSETLHGYSLQPLAVSDVIVNTDAKGDFLASFTPHTKRNEEPATFSIDVYDSTFTTFKGKLPVTPGTAHASLLNSVHLGRDGVVGNPPDEGTIPGGVGVVFTSAAADKNNAFGLPFDGETGPLLGEPCSFVTLESIDSTFQRFDFSPQWLGADGSGNLTDMVVGLQTRANADPVSDVFDPDLTLCPLSVTYSAGTLTGTVRETYKTYSTVLFVRDNVDAGFGEGSSIDDYIVHRSGPRITFAVVGNEYRAYLKFGSQDQQLVAVVSAPAAGPTYPLRLCGNTSSARTASKAVLNITRGGDQLSTIYSVANQIKFQGSQQSRVYLRIYQNAKDPLPNGVTTDIIVPPL